MKIAFSRSRTYTPTWNGNDKSEDPFRAIIRPTDMATLIDLVDVFQAAGFNGKVDTDDISVNSMKAIVASGAQALPRFVKIENLHGDDGEVTIQDVVDNAFFMKLALELLAKLADFSSPTDADEGN